MELLISVKVFGVFHKMQSANFCCPLTVDCWWSTVNNQQLTRWSM